MLPYTFISYLISTRSRDLAQSNTDVQLTESNFPIPFCQFKTIAISSSRTNMISATDCCSINVPVSRLFKHSTRDRFQHVMTVTSSNQAEYTGIRIFKINPTLLLVIGLDTSCDWFGMSHVNLKVLML